jgi:hypothetical protein
MDVLGERVRVRTPFQERGVRESRRGCRRFELTFWTVGPRLRRSDSTESGHEGARVILWAAVTSLVCSCISFAFLVEVFGCVVQF